MTHYLHPNDAIREAAQRLLTFRVCKVPVSSTPEDAAALKDDLMAVTAILDPIIEAFGTYARSTLGPVDMDLFRNQIRAALDGNAAYEIENAANEC